MSAMLTPSVFSVIIGAYGEGCGSDIRDIHYAAEADGGTYISSGQSSRRAASGIFDFLSPRPSVGNDASSNVILHALYAYFCACLFIRPLLFIATRNNADGRFYGWHVSRP